WTFGSARRFRRPRVSSVDLSSTTNSSQFRYVCPTTDATACGTRCSRFHVGITTVTRGLSSMPRSGALLHRAAIGGRLCRMHSGKAYHELMLASARDRKVRRRFQRDALGLLPPQAAILDFGAGTGLDAKVYAASG